MTLAEEAGDRIDLPVVGVGTGREVGELLASGGEGLLLGDRGLERLQLASEATGLGSGLPERLLGAGAPDVDERPDARCAHTEHRGDEPEHGLVGEDRGDADHHPDQRQTHAHDHAPVVAAVARDVHRAVTRSASSATMSLTRKSFGV
jgi:hypothetical protein